MARLNKGFSQYENTDLDNKAQEIVDAVNGGGVLPIPNPALTAVTTALTDYQAALAMPGNTPARTAAVTSTRDALEAALQTLGTTLEMLPGVTDTQLATTGFDLPSQRIRSSEAVAAPGNVRLKLNGMSGEVQVLCDSVPRAKTYQLQYALDPDAGPWNDGGVVGNTRNMVISGLTRAKDYWIRVRAIGPDGPGAWSDPATILVA